MTTEADVPNLHARAEREALCDALLRLGPDAPTLCEGWDTRDLAAHLVVREGRNPFVSAGVVVPLFAGLTERAMRRAQEGDSWPALVERIRQGPPPGSLMRRPRLDGAINTVEYFVHHEDVLRGGEGWSVRELDTALVDDLYAALGRAKLLVRKSPVGIVLQPTEGRPPITAKQGAPSVTVRGPVGELVLWSFGRQAHAVVDYDGPADAIEQVRTAAFGL